MSISECDSVLDYESPRISPLHFHISMSRLAVGPISLLRSLRPLPIPSRFGRPVSAAVPVHPSARSAQAQLNTMSATDDQLPRTDPATVANPLGEGKYIK